jgi:hypothetical protein
MTTVEIRTELQKMINEQEDITILQAIRTLLQKTSLNQELKSKLTSRARRSEDDITAGKLYTKEDMRKRTNRIGIGK